MSQSDDGADDPKLKSLRAVWLSMPDEDPPSRGLDALMAAARAQAEVFATPPWWKRALHALARPPVLALATIMILIGGAVLISKRDDIKEAGPAARSVAPAVTPATSPSPSPPPPSAGTDRRELDKLDEKKPEVAAPVPPAAKPPSIDHAEGRYENTKPTTPSPVHRAPARPRSTPEPTISGNAKPGGQGAPAFEQQDETAGKNKTPDAATKTTTEDTLDAKTGEAAPNQTRAPTPKQVIVDQLIVQCRAAATRGDCEEAKLIARRIAAQSTAYYKEHVANDATIQKCITPPPVNAAPVSQ